MGLDDEIGGMGAGGVAAALLSGLPHLEHLGLSVKLRVPQCGQILGGIFTKRPLNKNIIWFLLCSSKGPLDQFICKVTGIRLHCLIVVVIETIFRALVGIKILRPGFSGLLVFDQVTELHLLPPKCLFMLVAMPELVQVCHLKLRVDHRLCNHR